MLVTIETTVEKGLAVVKCEARNPMEERKIMITEWLGMRIRNVTWKLQPTSETSLFGGPRS